MITEQNIDIVKNLMAKAFVENWVIDSMDEGISKLYKKMMVTKLC